MAVDAWARGILKEALFNQGFPSPTLAQLQTLQGLTRGEGFYGRATKPAGWERLNNWGGIHSGFPPCEGNDLEITDNNRQVCAKSYLEPVDGAEDVIKWLKGVIPQFGVFTTANALLVRTKYHYQADPALYAKMLFDNARDAASAMHEHLVLLPPEAKPVNTDAIKSYLSEVNSRWASTEDAVRKQRASQYTGNEEPLPFSYEAFQADAIAWNEWYRATTGSLLGSVYLSDDVFDEARRWDQKQAGYYALLGKKPRRVEQTLPKTAAEIDAENKAKNPNPYGLPDLSPGPGLTILGVAAAVAVVAVVARR